MKIATLIGPEKLEVRDTPARREPGFGEVLVEPICVGLSGHDGLRFKSGPPVKDGYLAPMVLGSEFVARVVAMGRGVDPSLKGKRVVGNPVSPCFKCHWCLEGDHNLCPHVRILGVSGAIGALQQRFSWPAALCTPVPDEISNHAAVLLIQLANAVHIIDLANLKPMANCAVIGCGHLGLILIRALRAAGAGKILAVDLLDYRKETALSYGADHAIDPDYAREWVEELPRRGVDIAIDVSNASEACRLAMNLIRVGGRVMMSSAPKDNRVLFNAQEARLKQAAIQFVRQPHGSFERAVEWMSSGLIGDLEGMITHCFPLEKASEALTAIIRVNDDLIKAIIDMPEYLPREESPQAIHSSQAGIGT